MNSLIPMPAKCFHLGCKVKLSNQDLLQLFASAVVIRVHTCLVKTPAQQYCHSHPDNFSEFKKYYTMQCSFLQNNTGLDFTLEGSLLGTMKSEVASTYLAEMVIFLLCLIVFCRVRIVNIVIYVPVNHKITVQRNGDVMRER